MTILAKAAEEDNQDKNESDSGNSGESSESTNDNQEDDDKADNDSADIDSDASGNNIESEMEKGSADASEKTMADAAAAQTGDGNYLAAWGMLMLLAVIALIISFQVCRRTE